MTFDYFNTGRTAWGKKISGVFNTLELMAKAAEDRVAEITSNTDYYLQFTNRNYRAPEPMRNDLPARVEDLLSVMNSTIRIQEASLNNGQVTVKAVRTDEVNNRPISLSGTTSLKSGYVYARPANGSETIKGTLTFSSGTSDTSLYKDTALFYFEVIDNTVYLKNYGQMNTNRKGMLQYKSCSLQRVGTNSYTPTETYECVIADGGDTWFNLKLNNANIFDVGSLQYSHLHTTMYLRKGDKITGDTLTNIYKVKYNR